MLSKQLYSTKYVNAEIRETGEKRLHIRHIKYKIGGFWLTKIGQFYYLFRLNDEVYRTKENGSQNVEVVTYTTDHYLPLNNTLKGLEMCLEENDINKIDPMMANIFKELAKQEKKIGKNGKFTPHDLEKMIKEVSEYEKSGLGKIIPKNEQIYLIKKKSILNYLHSIDKKQIVTPIRDISNFIEGDVRQTDPQFLANIALSLGSIDYENKKVTNQNVAKNRPWLKYAAIGIILIMIVGLIMYAYQNHWFDTITTIGQGFQGLPNPVGGLRPADNKDDAYYMANYTPEELRAAIDRGEINENNLPPKTKEMLRNVPKVGTDYKVGG